MSRGTNIASIRGNPHAELLRSAARANYRVLDRSAISQGTDLVGSALCEAHAAPSLVEAKVFNDEPRGVMVFCDTFVRPNREGGWTAFQN